MSLTILDGILLGVMLISAFLAMMRGFVREVFSIGTWVAAAAAALFFHPLLLPYIEPYVANDLLSVALSAAAVFFATLIIVSFITIRISDFILESGAGPIDRTLGFMFGAARGLLIVVVAMMIFNGLVQRENRPVWITNAQSLPTLMEIGGRITAALPENIQESIAEFLGNRTAEPDSSILPSDDDPEPATIAPAAPAPAETVPQEDVPSIQQDSEELAPLDTGDAAAIPQDDARNVERIINATPVN